MLFFAMDSRTGMGAGFCTRDEAQSLCDELNQELGEECFEVTAEEEESCDACS